MSVPTAHGHVLRPSLTFRHVVAAAVLLAVAAVGAVPASSVRGAGTYYVATTGSDANDGSLSRPWRTVQKAADVIPAGSKALIRGGTYPAFHVRRSGSSASAHTIYANYPGERAVINGGGAYPIGVYVQYYGGPVRYVTISGLVIQNAPGGRGSGGGIVAQNAHHVRLRDNVIQYNRSYGIYLVDSTNVSIAGNEITKNEVGIYVTRQGGGSVIANNRIHHNDRMVINTASPGYDDYGATGIAFNKSTGSIRVRDNRIWGHRALSYDYDWDGSGIEIWMASNVWIERNTLYDNENVLETGSDRSAGCNDNRFVRNVAYGATTAGRSNGVYLRCAGRMLVANNTMYGLTQFAFQIAHLTGVHGGWIDGLRVQNNIMVTTSADDWTTWIRSALPSSVVIDRNLMFSTVGSKIAYVDGRGATTSLATFRSWTGRELTGVQADPRFVDVRAGHFGLAVGSTAIDRGVIVPGVTDGFLDAAPDLGRHESQ
jgi:parallel beta-helix repeat protein